VNVRRRLSTATSGRVKNQATTMSSSVERPRKKANPRTGPTVSRYSTAAPMKADVSAMRIVRNARLNPRSTEARTVRPARTSSFRRSKNTTYESTVTPIDTMMPVTPARLRASPEVRPRKLMIDHRRAAHTPSPNTTTRPRAR
jgi:hypothetical protein